MKNKQRLERKTKQQLSARDKEMFSLIDKCKTLQEELEEILKLQETRRKN